MSKLSTIDEHLNKLLAQEFDSNMQLPPTPSWVELSSLSEEEIAEERKDWINETKLQLVRSWVEGLIPFHSYS